MEVAFAENPIYAVMAVVGTLLYLIKILLLLFSGDGEMDDGNMDDVDHVDGGESFTVVSIQSILAFFMGCGWIGLAALHEWDLTEMQALAAAASFGFLMMLFSSLLTFNIKKLNSSPTVDYKTAKGKRGRAYTNIPAKGEGIGQVEITVAGKQQILQAMSTGEKIDAFTGILVEEVDDSDNLLVKKS